MGTFTATPLNKIKRDRGEVSSIIGIVLIVIYCLVPFYWILVSSLRPDSEILENSWWPRHSSSENYKTVLSEKSDFTNGLINSLVVSIIVAIVVLAVATFTAYALVCLSLRGKGVLMLPVIAILMFPLVTVIVPLLKSFTAWGWTDTYQAMIAPDLSLSPPLAVWNLTSFFRQMSQELEQSAMVGGCTPGQVFRKVILPLAAPGIFTTTIIIFIGARNEFLVAVTMIVNPSIQPATVLLLKLTGDPQFNMPFGPQMVAGVIMMLPLVIMVLPFQRRIVVGLAAGGLKQQGSRNPGPDLPESPPITRPSLWGGTTAALPPHRGRLGLGWTPPVSTPLSLFPFTRSRRRGPTRACS